MPQIEEMFGKQLGRLTLLGFTDRNKQGKRVIKCGCYCGNYKDVVFTSLFRLDRPTRSCGTCYDAVKYPKEYNCWEGIRDRCYRKTSKAYKYYGSRGIVMCPRWLGNFLHFMEDVGFAPSDKHSLERIDNDGNYEPGNCIWATHTEQMSNTSRSWKNRL